MVPGYRIGPGTRETGVLVPLLVGRFGAWRCAMCSAIRRDDPRQEQRRHRAFMSAMRSRRRPGRLRSHPASDQGNRPRLVEGRGRLRSPRERAPGRSGRSPRSARIPAAPPRSSLRESRQPAPTGRASTFWRSGRGSRSPGRPPGGALEPPGVALRCRGSHAPTPPLVGPRASPARSGAPASRPGPRCASESRKPLAEC